MAQIGKVSVAFTASTAELASGVAAAGRAFKSLGGDTTALSKALSSLKTTGVQSIADAGPAASAAAAAFSKTQQQAAELSRQFKDGSISAEQFRASMGDLVASASKQADQMARGAQITQQNRSAQETYKNTIAELNSLLKAGAISQETFQRAAANAAAKMREGGSAAKTMESGIDGIKNRLNLLIGLNVASIFARITQSIVQAGQSLLRFAGQEADAIDKTGKLAERLGFTYGEFAGLAHAAELSDVSMEQVGQAATRADVAFVKAAQGSAQAQAAFANINLTVEELNGMNPAERFQAITDAIAQLPTEAERSRAAVQLFGRAGAELLPLFNQGAGAIRAATQEADKFGLALTDAQRKDVEGMNDAFKNAYEAIRGVVGQIVAKLSPAVTAVTQAFTNLISGVGGKQIGAAIGDAILAGARYFAGVADWFIANTPKVWAYVVQVAQKWVGVWQAGQRVADFFAAVGRIFESAFKAIGSILVDIVGRIVKAAGDLAKTVTFGAWGGETQKAGKEMLKTAKTLWTESGQAFNASVENARNAFYGRAEETGQAIAGPVLTALEDAIAKADASAAKLDAAKPAANIEIKQKVDITASGLKQAVQGIDSRTAEGVKEMFRIMRGDTGNDVQARQLEVQERIADGIDNLDMGIVAMDIAS